LPLRTRGKPAEYFAGRATLLSPFISYGEMIADMLGALVP